MSTVGQSEIRTQRRVIEYFRDTLGYTYLGNWEHRPGNSNIEQKSLVNWLKRQGHSAQIIDKALLKISKASAVTGSKTLYEANREVHGLLRYGVKVQPGAGRAEHHRLADRLGRPHSKRLCYRRGSNHRRR